MGKKNDGRKWKKLYDEALEYNKDLQARLEAADIPAWEAKIAAAEAEIERVKGQRDKANGRASANAGKVKRLEAAANEREETIIGLERELELERAKAAEVSSLVDHLTERAQVGVEAMQRIAKLEKKLDDASRLQQRTKTALMTAGKIIHVFDQDAKAITRDLAHLNGGIPMKVEQRNKLANKVYDRMSRVFTRSNGILATMKGLPENTLASLKATTRWCDEKAEADDIDDGIEVIIPPVVKRLLGEVHTSLRDVDMWKDEDISSLISKIEIILGIGAAEG